MEDYKWSHITDLPDSWREYASIDLLGLAQVWRERSDHLKGTPEYQTFIDRMRREIAIETGIIERLYTIDRGITQLLIEEGIREALIPHGKTDRPAIEVVSLIRDQEQAIDGIFDFVAGRRTLSTGYIKEVHALLTRNQPTTEALVPTTGQLVEVDLLRGEYKRSPNNPQRADRSFHEYCPPEHVAAEMDSLIAMHNQHRSLGVPPEVEAAWLHHRFTQIHPFQDGNGRVARCLASLVFIQNSWFPLTLRDEDRSRYISALESADAGNLLPLVILFSQRQREAFLRALGISEKIVSESRRVDPIISAVRRRIEKAKQEEQTARIQKAEGIASALLLDTVQRLQATERKLKQELLVAEPRMQCYTLSANMHDEDKAQYHRIPTIEAARRLGFFANRQAHSSWAQLVIRLPSSRVELLIAINAVGHVNVGVYAVSAIAYHKDPNEEGTAMITEIEVLCESPFQFSHKDDEIVAKANFEHWLDNCIALGLSYWERSV